MQTQFQSCTICCLVVVNQCQVINFYTSCFVNISCSTSTSSIRQSNFCTEVRTFSYRNWIDEVDEVFNIWIICTISIKLDNVVLKWRSAKFRNSEFSSTSNRFCYSINSCSNVIRTFTKSLVKLICLFSKSRCTQSIDTEVSSRVGDRCISTTLSKDTIFTEDNEDRNQLGITIFNNFVSSTTLRNNSECRCNHGLTLVGEFCSSVSIQTSEWTVRLLNLRTINQSTTTTQEGDNRRVLSIWRCFNDWEIINNRSDSCDITSNVFNIKFWFLFNTRCVIQYSISSGSRSSSNCLIQNILQKIHCSCNGGCYVIAQRCGIVKKNVPIFFLWDWGSCSYRIVDNICFICQSRHKRVCITRCSSCVSYITCDLNRTRTTDVSDWIAITPVRIKSIRTCVLTTLTGECDCSFSKCNSVAGGWDTISRSSNCDSNITRCWVVSCSCGSCCLYSSISPVADCLNYKIFGLLESVNGFISLCFWDTSQRSTSEVEFCSVNNTSVAAKTQISDQTRQDMVDISTALSLIDIIETKRRILSFSIEICLISNQVSISSDQICRIQISSRCVVCNNINKEECQSIDSRCYVCTSGSCRVINNSWVNIWNESGILSSIQWLCWGSISNSPLSHSKDHQFTYIFKRTDSLDYFVVNKVNLCSSNVSLSSVDGMNIATKLQILQNSIDEVTNISTTLLIANRNTETWIDLLSKRATQKQVLDLDGFIFCNSNNLIQSYSCLSTSEVIPDKIVYIVCSATYSYCTTTNISVSIGAATKINLECCVCTYVSYIINRVVELSKF